MKKTDAINMLIEIRKIARNYEHNSGKRLSDILKVLDSVPNSVLVCKPIAQKSSPIRRPMRVDVNGITYESIDRAAADLGILPATVCKRCADPSEKFKGWTFIYTP